MHYNIGIVAHNTRVGMASALMESTRAVVLNLDDGKLGCSLNHIRTLDTLANAVECEDDWAVVLEDDAQPVGGFLPMLGRALLEAPTGVVSLYLGTGRPKHWQDYIRQSLAAATKLNSAWITSTHLIHAVGYAVRGDHIGALVDSLTPERPIDEAITAWCRDNRVLVSYTHPSLVDHEDGEPVIAERMDRQPRNEVRKAWVTGGRDHYRTRPVLMMQ